ncbi:MAG TPA: hypothetical protein VGV15_09825 [Terriglobales bacterium]|nr:hypothetical protein [Terriglobales bacterium]
MVVLPTGTFGYGQSDIGGWIVSAVLVIPKLMGRIRACVQMKRQQ